MLINTCRPLYNQSTETTACMGAYIIDFYTYCLQPLASRPPQVPRRPTHLQQQKQQNSITNHTGATTTQQQQPDETGKVHYRTIRRHTYGKRVTAMLATHTHAGQQATPHGPPRVPHPAPPCEPRGGSGPLRSTCPETPETASDKPLNWNPKTRRPHD